MAYITRDDIELEFGAGNVSKWADTDNDGVKATIAAKIAAIIADADDEVDARLSGGRYTVPFTGTAPRLINRAARLIAGVLLRRARGADDPDDPDGIENRYDEALGLLKGIRTGEIVLTDLSDTPTIAIMEVVDDE